MKSRPLIACFAVAFSLLAPLLRAAPEIATQFDFSSETTPGARKFNFTTLPGHRYTLWRSTNLTDWAPVPGYPQTATGLAIEHIFTQGTKEFFRIERIDDQGPEIVDQFPQGDSFAIRRFDDLRFRLSDATGIDAASIRLTLGNGAALAIGAPGLTYANEVLTFDRGDVALGAYGATIPVTLTVADTLGHTTSHSFSFTLEVLPKVVSNLYVFGSPTAQRSGQRIPATPTAALAKQAGPIRASSADPWSIESVLPDRVIISYTGVNAPGFAQNGYLTNLTPVKLSEIFYRKILSLSDQTATKKLTLMTVDVPFAEIVEEGTATLSADSVIYGLGAGGAIQPAVQPASQGQFRYTFEGVGINRDGVGPLNFGGDPKFSVSLPEANIWFTPTLDVSFEVGNHAVQRASIKAIGQVKTAVVMDMTYRPASVETQKEWPLHEPLTKLAFVGTAGPVPVWLDFTYTTKLKFEAEANSALTLRAGLRGSYSMVAGVTYTKGATPSISSTYDTFIPPLEIVPPTISIAGTAMAKLSLVPQLDVSLLSLIGFYVNATARVEADLSASASCTFLPYNGTVLIGGTAQAQATLGAFVDLNAGLKLWPFSQAYLPAFDPYRLYTWGTEFTYPPAAVLAFTVPSAAQAVGIALRDTLKLEGQAKGGTAAIFYQWYHNGILLPGQNSKKLTVQNAVAGTAGAYTLRAWTGTETVTSPAFSVTIHSPVPAVNGLAYIPAGSFQMGDQSNPLVGSSSELPVHTVQVSAFYMGKYEVTKELWDEVRTWGLSHGYTDLPAGNGSYASKGANYPVQYISWFAMVKWCNARSQKENLTLCYTVSGAIYKMGVSSPYCNWNANGYRLPTEAEWEKAARGGVVGKNFPSGTDTISHSLANYNTSSNNSYDLIGGVDVNNYHPTYAVGGHPYSSPVGSFSPNGYGLYDMAGNTSEWCWDPDGSYSAGVQTDPRASSSGWFPVLRGGSWYSNAYCCRVALRDGNVPGTAYGDGIGFRVARSSVP